MTLEKLQTSQGYKRSKGPVVAVIMDGVGLGSRDARDGVFSAYTPVLDRFLSEPLMVKLKAHGIAVGLPTDGDMGNSEVGHNALGAGRIFSQGAQLVNDALESGVVFETKEWAELKQRGQGGSLHFIGLLSDGNVHSNISQLFKIIDQCVKDEIPRVRFHILLDGRDVDQKSALKYIDQLEEKIASSQDRFDYQIASGGGRMVTTMDRYNANWDVVEKGWKAHVLGLGRNFGSAREAVETYYGEDPEITDQYMDSFVITGEDGKPVGTIEDGDGVVFFNFRGDRAIEISRAFDEDEFSEFDRQRKPDVYYAGLMQYDGDAFIPEKFLVQPPAIERTLGEYLCASGVTSFAISETQKFGHVTYFWNGNKSGYIDDTLEKYVEVPSDKIAFDLKPWMKAGEITDKVIEAVESGDYRFIRCNLANGDMVGHTGKVASVRIAVETVDICLERIERAVKKAGGILVVTADHGNADCMWNEKNGERNPMVAHTLNPVPFIVMDHSGANSFVLSGVENPGLANFAATICTLLGLQPPEDYEPSLLTLAS